MFAFIRQRRAQNALLEAIIERDLQRVQELAAGGLDLNFEREGFSPLIRAFSRVDPSPKDRAAVNLLIKLGASPSGPGNEYLLGSAARQGDHDMIDLALAAGHDIHERPKNSHTALQGAAHRGKVDTMRYLIAKGATKEDFDVSSCTWYSIRNEVIRLLLELGVDVPKDVREFLREDGA